MKLLLAEDSTPLRGIIRQMLAGLGHNEIVEAADGLEAWTHLQTGGFDLLLTDWNMPRMSGLKLLQKVRQSDDLQSLPVVMLTTRSNKQDIISAMKAGVNNYVTKPCKPSDLQQKLEKAVLQQARKQPNTTAESERILAGSRRFRPSQRGPYVLLYEVSGDMEAFVAGRQGDLLRYFGTICEVLDKANDMYPGLELGYRIEKETKEITRLVNDAGELVRLVMISAREDAGVSLARRLCHGQRKPPPTYLVCDSLSGLGLDQRNAVAGMGVDSIERSQIDADRFRQLLKSHLVPMVESGPDGLKYLTVLEGTGGHAKPGKLVTVEVQGMLRDGAVFEDSRQSGEPLQFVIGQGEVAPGLELGVGTMRQGGRSLFVLPAELGYPEGDEERGISAGDKLIYAVELVGIRDAPHEEEDILVE